MAGRHRWGADTSSDKLRRCARCTGCGHKGRRFSIRAGAGADVGFLPFPPRGFRFSRSSHRWVLTNFHTSGETCQGWPTVTQSWPWIHFQGPLGRISAPPISVGSASIGNNVRRADSSSLPRPYCHFELQRGPSPNIAHSFFASPESPLAQVGMWAISSAVAEQPTIAQPQLSFCYFACLTASESENAIARLPVDEDARYLELRAAIPIRMPTPSAMASANSGRFPVSSLSRFSASEPYLAASLPSAVD